MLKERIECQLGQAALSLGTKDCVTLCCYQYNVFPIFLLLLYLSRTCDTQCSQQSIASLSSRCSQDAFEESDSTASLEDVPLSCILLKHSCKGESFYCSLSLVVCWWLDRDVGRRILRSLLDIEKSLAFGLTWSQAQEDVEQRRGGLLVLHAQH